jgi:hypothetical protein
MQELGEAFKRAGWARKAYELVSLPLVALFLLDNRRIHPAYRMTWRRKFRLAARMYSNTKRVTTGMSYRAHLVMASKLLEVAPEVEGVVVECGSFKGGTTANLSLVCDIVGRELVVYDSFEGLPPAREGDKTADPKSQGMFRGDLDEVRANVARVGAIDRCTFRKGWFDDTLPHHREPIVLCLLDVDFQASLDTCVRGLWPHLTAKGYLFLDECLVTDYCALFFSERYWRKHFDTTPPGLVGAGSGVGVGQYWVGPSSGTFGMDFGLRYQAATSVAYTRKDLSGFWDYYPD